MWGDRSIPVLQAGARLSRSQAVTLLWVPANSSLADGPRPKARLETASVAPSTASVLRSLLSVSQRVTRWLKARPWTVPSLLQLPAVQARPRSWREELQVQEEVEAAHSLALESWPTDRRRGEGEQGWNCRLATAPRWGLSTCRHRGFERKLNNTDAKYF